jgi:hypothetical protein
VIGYFRDIWNGAPPLSRILWVDMLAVGTLVNFVMLLAMIAILAAKAPTAVALAVFLLPPPRTL